MKKTIVYLMLLLAFIGYIAWVYGVLVAITLLGVSIGLTAFLIKTSGLINKGDN